MEDHCSGASEQFPWTADETVAAKESKKGCKVEDASKLTYPSLTSTRRERNMYRRRIRVLDLLKRGRYTFERCTSQTHF